MTPANVDRLSLVGWYMQRQGWDDRVMGRKKKPKFKGSSKAKTAQAHAKSKSQKTALGPTAKSKTPAPIV